MEVTDLDRIDWKLLTIESLWTLSRIVGPVMEGELQCEIARRLGLTRQQVASRMGRLRRELREQLAEDPDG